MDLQSISCFTLFSSGSAWTEATTSDMKSAATSRQTGSWLLRIWKSPIDVAPSLYKALYRLT